MILFKYLLFKLYMVLVCHINFVCWPIGDNQYNCNGNFKCEYEVDSVR